ncbi:hypothetical protein F5B17DRAFT_126427 [Nemania serpens]|nr:hypothetical protein F5B17DRAFT_126427 [Nemania serpens]
MALALRLTALSYVVVQANARCFQAGPNAGDWTPVTPTAGRHTSSSDEWIPKTTSAPDRRPRNGEFQRRDDNTPTICGYSVNMPDGPPVTCDSGGFCRLDRVLSIVGCCTVTNPRGCIVPTACLEFTKSAQWSGDPLTTYCDNSNRPHCVTHSYDASFFDPLYGAYFIGCGARAASGDIVATSPLAGSNASSTQPASTTATNGVITTTVTVGIPSSPTAASPGSSVSHGSKNVAAIAGGVVGGVAGLALIAAAIFFFLYRRRKRLQASDSLALGRKMPPSDHDIYHDMYHNEPIPGSQYPSTFYGEAPPGMVQASDQPIISYPPNTYGFQVPVYPAEQNPSAEVPAYHTSRIVPSKPQDDVVSPIEESPVSPVSPAENYNTMVSALSNPSPPLQPLQPAARRPRSEYAQYSPAPPEQWQSYRPYPGT